MDGTVKWFSDSKGYGFLTDGKQDYFVHHSDIQSTGFKSLKEGERVQFTGEKGAKGMVARGIVKVDSQVV